VTSGFLNLKMGGNSAIRIAPTSNVLINSTTDDTVNKLQVTGTAKFTSDVGVGTTPYNFSGYNTLTVSGTTGGILNLQYNGTNGCRILSQSTSTEMFEGRNLPINFSTNGVIRLIINNGGIITITNLAGTGSRAVLADASGNLSAPVSDITVKENVQPLKYGLNAIMQLNPISFEYVDDYKNYGEGLQIGNIAQDVEKIIPEAVFTTPSTGLKGINYDQFNGIYIKAIQEQQKIIESLIQRIELLENK
jgi:hypothetical protein